MTYYIYGIKRREKPEIIYIGKRQQKVDPNIDDYMGSGRILLGFKRKDGFIYEGLYKKEGIKNFEKIILEKDLELKNVNEKERYYIGYYKEIGEAQ